MVLPGSVITDLYLIHTLLGLERNYIVVRDPDLAEPPNITTVDQVNSKSTLGALLASLRFSWLEASHTGQSRPLWHSYSLHLSYTRLTHKKVVAPESSLVGNKGGRGATLTYDFFCLSNSSGPPEEYERPSTAGCGAGVS
jgi:hypothetical protein